MSDINTRRIHIKGVVQGVGFRPFVYSTAKDLNITGWVRNSSAGVDIVASGETKYLDLFIDQIKNNPPPLSVIDMFEWSECSFELFSDFNILKSKVIPGEFIPISADIAICADCQHELFDPGDHRYRYPFINCTNCGPRLTIIKDIPYDRPLTTMASFPMCCMHIRIFKSNKSPFSRSTDSLPGLWPTDLVSKGRWRSSVWRKRPT